MQIPNYAAADELLQVIMLISQVHHQVGKPCKKLCFSCKEDLKLNSSSLVVEIASNDGYLLEYVKKEKYQVLELNLQMLLLRSQE